MNTTTEVVTQVIGFGDMRKSETELLTDALICAASSLDPNTTSTVDAQQITYAFMKRRSYQQDRIVGEDEVHDYVRHMLREAPYVCRYAIDRGSQYLLHPSPQCSDQCSKHDTRLKSKTPVGELCPDCFLWVPAASECDFCH